MRVLGVDPGTIRVGWGVVDQQGSRFQHVASSVINAGRGELTGRLAMIQAELEAAVDRFAPDALSLERNFLAHNVQSSFRIGESRGVVIALAGRRGLPLGEYSPATIKKSVSGSGRASKQLMQDSVVRLLALKERPAEDAADALAAALCHAFSSGMQSKIDAALMNAGPRSRARSGRR